MAGNKVIGLESQYVKWSPLTILLEEYLERPGLQRIIQMCRLKPRSILERKRIYKTNVIREWIDEHGNCLNVIKKKLSIQLNDLAIDRKKLVGTDLYEGLPIQKVGAMSCWAFLLAGKEGANYQDHYVAAFVGLDDYLRSFCFLDGEWFPIPSLYLGMKTLGVIVKNRESNWLTELTYKGNVVYPCSKQRMWFTGWPSKTIRQSFSGDVALERLLETIGA